MHGVAEDFAMRMRQKNCRSIALSSVIWSSAVCSLVVVYVSACGTNQYPNIQDTRIQDPKLFQIYLKIKKKKNKKKSRSWITWVNWEGDVDHRCLKSCQKEKKIKFLSFTDI